MKYIHPNIINDEKVIFISPFSYWNHYVKFSLLWFILSMIFFINNAENIHSYGGLMIGGMINLIAGIVSGFFLKLTVTNKRIIGRFNFQSSGTINLDHKNIAKINVHQGFVGRMLNTGAIVIDTNDNESISIEGILQPIKFYNQFNKNNAVRCTW